MNLNSKVEASKNDILNIEIFPQFKKKYDRQKMRDSDEFFSFKIVRDGTKIWDTSIGNLIIYLKRLVICKY
jgi:hypothetical protein